MRDAGEDAAPGGGGRGGRRLALIVAALLLPIIPVWLVGRHGLGDDVADADAADFGAETRARIAARPGPAGDPVPLAFGLAPGRSWTVAITLRAEDRVGASRRDDDSERALRARERVWRFTVLAASADGFEVEVLPEDAPDAGGLIAWPRSGPLTWLRKPEGAELPPRAWLAAEHALWLPAIEDAAPRTNGRIGPAMLEPTFRGRDVARRLDLAFGADSGPTEQGVWLVEARDGLVVLEELGVRARSAAGPSWAGGHDLAVEGRFTAPRDALERVSGRRVVHERIEAARDEATSAVGEYVIEIEQTATPR